MAIPKLLKRAWSQLVDNFGQEQVGDVSETPGANTVLGRLKAINDNLGDGITVEVSEGDLNQGGTAVGSGNPLYTQAEDGKIATLGAKTDSPASSADAETATARSGIALFKAIKNLLIDIKTKLNASLAVTGTFWQATQPVSLTHGAFAAGDTSKWVKGATAAIVNTDATSVIAAPGLNTYLNITSIMVTNGHASVGTYVQITDGSGGTVIWDGFAAAAGGGFMATFPVPLRLTVNTALYCQCVTTGSSIKVCAAGYKSS